ncbi:hypothetical protein [Achromobacter ruhlandii]|uniref:hypothetical protein n=1 Tax=Achromobacter ruhlandii TaxID=72557 RepID=UPI0007BEED6B|nr:hypothetical protein [Achromobacter ruhlandii]
MLYYSKSMAGFYDETLHATIPADATPVSNEMHADLMFMQTQGKEIVADANGNPIAVDPAPLTPQQLEAVARALRDESLSTTDWMVARYRDEIDSGMGSTLTAEQFREILAFRQALRDWPDDPEFPNPESQPAAPAWLASVQAPS